MKSIEESLVRARQIKLMIFDVDGVLTDGSLYFTDAGAEIKVFHARDGLGMTMLKNAGIILAIITGRNAECVNWRMKNLGIEHVYQGIGNKLTTFKKLLDKVGVAPHETGFMGDDLIDLQVMATCGFSATPADGHELNRQHADYVASKPGGHGAVREVTDFILAAQGKLDEAVAPYLPSVGV